MRGTGLRIGVVSDIHGNLPALLAVADDLAGQDVDLVVNLGDIVSGPVDPAGTAAHLIGLNWVTVAGNHERQLLSDPPERTGWVDAFARDRLDVDQTAWLRTLPGTVSPAPGVLGFHGTPTHDTVYLLETVDPAAGPDALRRATQGEIAQRLEPTDSTGWSLLLCGHSHLARAVRLEGGPLIVNPGSVGWPAYDDDVPHVHRVEAGSPHARYAVVTGTSEKGWAVEFRQVRYDWDAAAEVAAANGRPDIAAAMRTGRLHVP